jgi:hypothetical protein
MNKLDYQCKKCGLEVLGSMTDHLEFCEKNPKAEENYHKIGWCTKQNCKLQSFKFEVI